MIEQIERRIFGGVEFVHGITGARVARALRINAPGLELRPNSRGIYVIHKAAGLETYADAFEGPPTPPIRPYEVEVIDPQGSFLPQRFSLSLPRRLPGAAVVPDAENVLKPLRVPLWAGAAVPLEAGWAVLRLRVTTDAVGPETGLANVLVEATPKIAGAPVQRALTDGDGEALVAIPGIPPILPGSGGSGLTSEFKLALKLVVDASVVRPSTEPRLPVPDPVGILRRRDAGEPGVRSITAGKPLLSAGTSRRHIEKVTWP